MSMISADDDSAKDSMCDLSTEIKKKKRVRVRRDETNGEDDNEHEHASLDVLELHLKNYTHTHTLIIAVSLRREFLLNFFSRFSPSIRPERLARLRDRVRAENTRADASARMRDDEESIRNRRVCQSAYSDYSAARSLDGGLIYLSVLLFRFSAISRSVSRDTGGDGDSKIVANYVQGQSRRRRARARGGTAWRENR